jgi:meckelin
VDCNRYRNSIVSLNNFLFLALVQYLIYILFYQRFVEDTLLNFVDLCSVSNISVFILTDTHYGYYLHGRSPHGTTDVNIRDMIMNLERESNQMSGTRGLQAKSDEQIFIMKLARPFRGQYNQLLQSYKVKNKNKNSRENVYLII